MQIRRLFSDLEEVQGNILIINGDEAHYGIKVLRLQNEDIIEIITEQGMIEGQISNLAKKTIEIQITSQTPKIINEPEIEIILFQGIPDHFEKFELITQKTTELGITKIIPFTSKYTDAKYKKINIEKKLERAKKIAKEAVRQCKRTFIPTIEPLTTFEKAVEQAKTLEKTYFFAEYQLKNNIEKTTNPKQLGIFIGAEGGFSEEEFKKLADSNFSPVHLKGRVLRTETAAITAVSLIQHKFGDYKNSF